MHKSGGMCTSLRIVHKSRGMCTTRGTCAHDGVMCTSLGACALVGGICTSRGACAQVGAGGKGQIWGHVHTTPGICRRLGAFPQIGSMCKRVGACPQVGEECVQVGGHVHKSGGMCTTRGTCAQVWGYVHLSGVSAQGGGGACAHTSRGGGGQGPNLGACAHAARNMQTSLARTQLWENLHKSVSMYTGRGASENVAGEHMHKCRSMCQSVGVCAQV